MVASQQAKSSSVEAKRIKGTTYKQEVAVVRQKLMRQGKLTSGELRLLVHDQLMDQLRKWASDENVPYCDVRAALDSSRDVLYSVVHLKAAGNRMVAASLAAEIHRHLANGTVRWACCLT